MLRVNCAETIQDRPRQSAYEMFGIKRRFRRCKVWPPRFKESSVRAHQIWVPPWKWLQIDTDLLHIITSTADELFGCTNIDDLERPWTPKIWVLSEFFAILGCGAHLEWIFAEIYWKIIVLEICWWLEQFICLTVVRMCACFIVKH